MRPFLVGLFGILFSAAFVLPAAASCGDGVLDPGEGCDDGNTLNCDGCSATCTIQLCNDNNVCTTDTCNPETGCVFTDNTNPCSDGNACTVSDTCASGQCQPGAPRSCDDNNACTIDDCDTAVGCEYTNNNNPCTDLNACTVGDTCVNGSCRPGASRTCDDGNACTTDSCDQGTGCVFTPNTNPCSDGSACTVGDTCASGQCQPGTPRSCDDGNVCTTDSCDPGTGCVFSPNTSACSDGSACTAGDVCASGQCQPGAAVVCDDDNVCTDDSCDPASGCVHANTTAPCSDGDACTAGDTCRDGSCGGDVVDCDDGDPCTIDSCDPSSGCVHQPDPGCEENHAPDCSAAVAVPGQLWPPDHRNVRVSVVGVGDADGDPVTLTITGIKQDEPLDARGGRDGSGGDGATCPDAQGVGSGSALVRAERSALGDGRVYHVAFGASDGRGGTCEGVVLVCVPHDRRPGRTCVDEGPLYDATGPCSANGSRKR